MLTPAEYGEAIRNRGILQGKIEACKEEVVELGRLTKLKVAEGKAAGAALELYSNHLSDDIKEYEEAQPAEE